MNTRKALASTASILVAAGLALVTGGAPAQAAPGDNLAWTATPSASYTSPWESVAAIRDGIDPPRSNDTANPRWGTWPNQGQQWAELTWTTAQTVRAVEVYFFDDGGGVRVPASWRVQRWTGSAFADVTGASGYPVAADRYNQVTFTAVSTTRLRITLQSGAGSVGLLEVKAHGATTPPPASGWNPPANLVTPLNQVWAHQEQTYHNGNLYGFRNYGWDQLFANRGHINYCVRWDSSAPVTAAQRDQVHATLARQYRKWMDAMVGHNNWPYTEVPVRVVGWAVRDRAQLQWSDNSVDIYVGDIRENAPQCAAPCGRFFNQGGQYPNCPGGAARHYDHSLWLTDGFGGGAGGDWGQRMGREYYMNNLNAENMTILLHEIGHTYGLDDFYDWTPSGVGGFIMRAGSASSITEFDRWMLRDWWRHLKSRYGY
ncbi:cellulose-binding protein [Asanoa sp. WMMD1127]|uniref:cellulose-binding protein n=1 Tax=Asanoa sp. WMMD1127 TaxID=3016107 RepID=UPI002415A679|nr:cellulose-binding protein [Asanoa sp. WMMD1127]MDG4821769.1 cellulose-binding protein [Asanoa sp. WMMD1127]